MNRENRRAGWKKKLPPCPLCGLDSGERVEDAAPPFDYIVACTSCGARARPYEDAAASIDKDKLAKLMCLDALGYSAKDIEIITPEQYEAEFGGDEDG